LIKVKLIFIIFLFLVKTGSVRPVEQQIKFVSPYKKLEKKETQHKPNKSTKQTRIVDLIVLYRERDPIIEYFTLYIRIVKYFSIVDS